MKEIVSLISLVAGVMGAFPSPCGELDDESRD